MGREEGMDGGGVGGAGLEAPGMGFTVQMNPWEGRYMVEAWATGL